MYYIEARKEIQSGDLLGWSGNSIFSKTIKIFTNSYLTHVGIAWKIGGRLFVLESVEGKGVQIFPLSRRLPFFWIQPIERTHEWNEIVEETALQRIGEKYSLIGCAKAFFKKALPKDDRWQCAEFASYILSLIGYHTNGYNIPQNLVQEMLRENCVLVNVVKKKQQGNN